MREGDPVAESQPAVLDTFSMAMVVMRARSDAEFARLREILAEYEDGLPADLRHGLEPDARSLRGAYDDSNAAFLALIDDAVAGCVALTGLDASTAVVKRLYVKSAYRRSGLARTLVAAATTFARERGYRRIVLDTDRERLSAAYRLYQSLGFSDCEPYGSVAYANPTYMEMLL